MQSLENVKILYIEDEDFIRKNAIEYLRFHCNFVYEAVDGIDGFEKYKEIKPNIIICDIMMPRLNGLELIEKIRLNDRKTQIIVTTARLDTQFLIKAVELRLIKYLIKPITEDILLPVLNEALTYVNDDTTNILEINTHCKFDKLNKVLLKNNEAIKITKKELLFLELCAKNIHRAVTYDEIESYVWDGYMTGDAMRSIVKDLRKKISKEAIENISGIGYKLKTLCD